MAYYPTNFKTKKEFRARVDALNLAPIVRFEYDDGVMGCKTLTEGQHTTIEGPHSPQPHTWYAEVSIKDGKIKVK